MRIIVASALFLILATGARAQSVPMSVWRTCWQRGRSALDFLSQLLRGTPMTLALPPYPAAEAHSTQTTLPLPQCRWYHPIASHSTGKEGVLCMSVRLACWRWRSW